MGKWERGDGATCLSTTAGKGCIFWRAGRIECVVVGMIGSEVDG